jgi:heme/copper-type cytochrome/quinol oxidase subunit 2
MYNRVFRWLSFAIAILAGAPAALGQCALCYEAASAAGAHARKSLDIGILVLLLPCLTLFVGVFVLLIRRAHAATA